MSNISQLCDEILRQNSQMNRHVDTVLRPGLSNTEVQTKASALPFKVPTSVQELYGWRDGTTEGSQSLGDMWLLPGYYLLSLEKAIETYHGLLQTLQVWGADCLPLLSSGSGDYYGIRCQQGDDADGPMFEYLGGDPEPQLMFSSLEAMLQTCARCFASGIFFLENGVLEIDDDGFDREAAQCDPTVDRE